MKMARASQADIDAALEVNRIIDDLAKGYMPASDDDDGYHRFDRDDAEQCKVVLGKLLDAADKGSIFRVTFGMQVVLDPRNELLNPNADTLEKHPKTVDALETQAWLAKRGSAGVVIDAYAIEDPREAIQIKVLRARQIDGPDLWKVMRGSNCLNRDAEWEYEPLPSSRDEEFLARCRYATVDDAIDAALNAQKETA